MNIVSHLRNLRRREHTCTVEIVESLVTCNRERAYLEHGCSTIWDFLVRELRYSNAAASRRYKAMKCAEKFPQVIEMLKEHKVTLSSLAQAESLLNEVRNPDELLARIAGKTQSEVERILTTERPVPKKPTEVIRRVAVKRPEPSGESFFEMPTEPIEQRVTVRTSLTEEHYDAFEMARAIVSRKHPSATVEDVLNELVAFYLKNKAPRKRAERKSRSRPNRTRHIPVAIRDEVMLRDEQRCTFRSKTGRRCGTTHGLQLDHIKPFALGGTHEAKNLRVLCAAHNRDAARRTFGERSVPLRN